jgi:L-malate glycosyltransferase
MKVLVSLHDLALGGTTVNAIDLATALRERHGHDVVLFASPGPLMELVVKAGLRCLLAPVARAHPSPSRMTALRAAVRQERPDLLHVWETWACFDAYCGVHLPMGVPLLVTDMQMHLTKALPMTPTTTFGTPELVDRARAAGRRHVELLLPPVDMGLNTPGAVDAASFRQRCGLRAGEIAVVTVSRLVDTLKGESLLRTIDTVGAIGHELPLRLVIVGDGSARAAVSARAQAVNARLGREAVILPGALLDPRPAYAAADIVVGMGGSALRAMAFAKPTIIVGEGGFARTFDAASAPDFLYQGMYGVAGGDPDNRSLATALRKAANDPSQLAQLGEFSHRFVMEHFSLDVVAAQLSNICSAAVARGGGYAAAGLDTVRTAAVYLRDRRFLWRSVPPPTLNVAKTA